MTSVAPLPGDVIEDYEIVEKIGGNMGLVFKARHRLLDKIVALKLLPVDFITDAARLARFQRELRIMGQLEHPNLVTAGDARIVGCWHLVAMELIEGMDLQHLIQTLGPLPVAAACEVARQAALGLQYAHQHGLIHRDIKPSNLMLTRAGTVKVIDMGLALIKEESTAQLTQTGFLLGTMSYCAPEQFRDSARVDTRADIYSLGCTLYHLLTGKAPYWQRTTLAEVVQAHLNEAFPSVLEARLDAPKSLEAVVARMTAKEPAARFATAEQVAEALTPFAQGADTKHLLPETAAGAARPIARTDKWPDSPARTPGKAPAIVVSPVPPPARPTAPASRETQSAAGMSRGKRLVVALVALLAVTGAVLLASSLWKRHIIVLMDTTAPGGVYEPADRAKGVTNAERLRKVLLRIPGLQPGSFREEKVSLESKHAASVLSMRPRLVLIHRSSFFHPLIGELQILKEEKKWQIVYDFVDEKLKMLIGYLGMVDGHMKFLIYSRGTDVRWKDPTYRDNWVKDIEETYPKLKGRIRTIVIPGEMNGTFEDPETGRQMREAVKDILNLSD